MDSAEGAYLVMFIPESPADEANLRIGDIVLAVNGVRVADATSFLSSLHGQRSREGVILPIQRGQRVLPVEAVLTSRPSDEELSLMQEPVAAPTTGLRTDSLVLSDLGYARKRELAFYPEASLFEFGAFDSACLQSFVITSSGDAVTLDGNASHIHEFNSGVSLMLGSEVEALEYVKFFVGHTWAGEGAFRLIETTADLLLLPDAQAPLLEAPEIREEGSGFIVEANILYGRQLYRATLSVSSDGSVDMPTDTPIAGSFDPNIAYSEGIRCARDLSRVDEADYPILPAMPGVWLPVEWDEFYEMRQLLLIQDSQP